MAIVHSHKPIKVEDLQVFWLQNAGLCRQSFAGGRGYPDTVPSSGSSLYPLQPEETYGAPLIQYKNRKSALCRIHLHFSQHVPFCSEANGHQLPFT